MNLILVLSFIVSILSQSIDETLSQTTDIPRPFPTPKMSTYDRFFFETNDEELLSPLSAPTCFHFLSFLISF